VTEVYLDACCFIYLAEGSPPWRAAVQGRLATLAMVQAYWLIGREIVEVEQHGETRAGYGERVVERLSKRLTAKLGKGYSAPNLRNMRQFFQTFPPGSALPAELGAQIRAALPSKSRSTKIRSAAPSKSIRVGSAPFPPNLGWTHYASLMRVANPTARAFYEIEAVRESWSSRELERQIASLLFERLAKSRDKEKVIALARRGQLVATPEDVLKDPFVLEFLGLDERAHWRERDLEKAIIDRIGDFLSRWARGSASSRGRSDSRSKAIISTSISSSTTACSAASSWSISSSAS
jgi:predicted nuclease of restriction endonuclease-like (RecB) superfamily